MRGELIDPAVLFRCFRNRYPSSRTYLLNCSFWSQAFVDEEASGHQPSPADSLPAVHEDILP